MLSLGKVVVKGGTVKVQEDCCSGCSIGGVGRGIRGLIDTPCTLTLTCRQSAMEHPFGE
jgi:hypothetical protein